MRMTYASYAHLLLATNGSLAAVLYLLHHNPIYLLFQFLQFLRTALTSRGSELPYPRIQCFLVDTVGGTIGFAVPVVAFANIFHTAATVPIVDYRNKQIAALGAGQKPRITMLDLIAGSRGIPGVLVQQLLHLIPILSLDNDRIDALVPKLLRFRYCISCPALLRLPCARSSVPYRTDGRCRTHRPLVYRFSA